MKERPILFSAPMVRAILAGTKTQTRRVCKNHVRGNGTWSKSLSDFVCENDYLPPSALLMDYRAGGHDLTTSNMEGWGEACPYGQPGDRLWVRETWAHHRHAASANCVEDGPFVYSADGEYALRERLATKWTPGIHMFRWASRITLVISSVRVERLQEISEADALAEGSRDWAAEQDTPVRDLDEARLQFRALWTAINGGESWDANPWVWVVEFKRVEQQR